MRFGLHIVGRSAGSDVCRVRGLLRPYYIRSLRAGLTSCGSAALALSRFSIRQHVALHQ